MDKKDKKPGLNRKGLDTMGKRLLVLTLAILMTFQFCTPTFSGVSFAEEEPAATETVEPVETAVTEEAPADVQEEQQPVTEETGEVSGEAAEEQVEPAAPEEVTVDEPAEDVTEEQPAEVAQEETSEEPAPAEVKEETKPEADAEKYPAASFEKSAGDTNVTVIAPEGALPEGTEMAVKEVTFLKLAQVKSAVKDELGSEAKVVKAVDITFTKDGKEVQPREGFPLQVSFSSAKFANLENASVVHVDDNKNATKLEDGVVAAEGNEVAFEADQFSIYAIVDGEPKIVTVNFYDENGNLVNTQYVKKIDNAVQDCYNPQWELEYGTEFYGWSTEAGTTPIGKIESVNELIESNWDSYPADTPVSFYAAVQKVYVVTFNRYNDEGVLVVLDTVTVPVDAADKTIEIPGDLGTELGDEFLGWLSQDGTQYAQGASYTVTDHTSFYLKEQGRAWLIFDSNAGGPGSGATYTPPQLIFGNGVVTTKPADPTRKGYKFLGWNESPEGNGTWWSKTDDASVNGFGTAISEDVTLYAQWEGDETNYYVIYWKQSASDAAGLADDQKTYVYVASSEARTAKTGDTVPITDADKTYNVAGTNESINFFEYNEENSDLSKTVAADGSTTLNVYYDRKEITYNFDYGTETKTISGYELARFVSNNNYVYAIKIDGVWHQITEYGYYVWNASRINSVSNGTIGFRYGGSNYNLGRYSNSAYSVPEDKSFTGLYGSSFTEWPEAGDDREWYYGGYGFPLALTVFDPLACYNGNNPSSFTDTTITFTAGSGDTGGYKMYVYVQSETGDWVYTDDYVLSTANLGYDGTWYPTETFTGFTIHSYQVRSTINTSESAWTSITNSGHFDYNNNVFLRYSRNQHKITYVSQGTHTTGRTTHTETGIYYDASLSGYDTKWTPTNGADGYAFAGWYADEACNVPFDFSKEKMGDTDLTVYAKWITQRCRVVLNPNAPEGSYEFANNQGLSFRVDYNEKVDSSNITGTAAKRTGYVLDYWLIEGTNKQWNFDTLVNSAVDGVNPNYQSTEEWANNTYGDNDGAHDNVVNLLKLKAHWKLNVQDNSVYVIYKVGDEYCVYNANGALQTNIPVDESPYVLQPGAASINFQLAEPPTGYNDGYDFKDWALLNPDGSKSGTTYQATSTHTVTSDYFKEETLTDEDGNTATIRYVILEAEFTVQVDKATMVVFDGNGGKTSDGDTEKPQSYLVNKEFQILGNDTFTREGYTFKEWNTSADGTGNTLEAGTTVAADNLDGAGWDASSETNRVYAIWKPRTDIPYTVEYYYMQNDGTYSATATGSDTTRTGTTDTTVEVTDDDKTPKPNDYSLTGTYVLDENKDDDWTGTVAGDGSLVLKVYFKQQFTITYQKGDHGTFDDIVYNNQDYGATTLQPEETDLTHEEGYRFAGWEPEVSTTVSGNATYVAQWEPDPELTYTVTYSAVNGTVSTAANNDIQILTTEGVTGSTAAANEGYKFDGWYKGEDKISGDLTLSTEDAVANLNKTEAGNYADTAYVAKFVVDDEQTYTVT